MGRHKVFTDEEAHQRNLKRIKEWRKKNPDKVAAQQKRYQEKHKEQLRIYNHNKYMEMKENGKRVRQNIIFKSRCPELFPPWYFCMKCDYRLSLDHVYCPNCGKKLNWNNVKG